MIESLQNEQVKYVVSLQRSKHRKEARLFVAEGWRFVGEALSRNAALEKVMVCLETEQPEWPRYCKIMEKRGIPVEEVSQRVFRKMSATEEPQGILALVRQKSHTLKDLDIRQDTVMLVIDRIRDPGNLGTILRTALAAGVNQVCLTPGTVDLYSPKVLRATMGAVFSLTLLPEQPAEMILAFCRKRGIGIFTADTLGTSVFETGFEDGPLALVLGNEDKGSSSWFRQTDAKLVRIPMEQDVESLNVSIAAGVLLYEIKRRRIRTKCGKGDKIDP